MRECDLAVLLALGVGPRGLAMPGRHLGRVLNLLITPLQPKLGLKVDSQFYILGHEAEDEAQEGEAQEGEAKGDLPAPLEALHIDILDLCLDLEAPIPRLCDATRRRQGVRSTVAESRLHLLVVDAAY